MFTDCLQSAKNVSSKIIMKVAILGAGGAGITSIKCCLDEGLEPECFEQNDDIGGMWLYSEETSHSSIYQSTIINTSKEKNAFSDFPMPKHFPPFMTHDYMLEYYHLYANNFDLIKYIKFSCKIVDVHREERQWKVTYEKRADGSSRIEHKLFDAVLVCTGHLTEPRWVDFSGLDGFQGRVLHSHHYKTFKGFENKDVLVVGLGNSAGDIACDLSRHAQKTFISTRRGAWVRSRLVSGLPFDYYYTRFEMDLPDWIRYPLFGWIHIQNIDHSYYGLKPQGGYWDGASIINEDIITRITTGKLSIKPNIDHFTEHGVVFTDGSELCHVDAVIFCTGYKIGLSFLNKEIITSKENNELDLYKLVFPPDDLDHTLAFIGYVTINGSMNPTFEIQARWVTRVLKGLVKLPSPDEMWKDILKKRKCIKESLDNTPRHALTENGLTFQDEVASLIGCRPNLWHLLITDPVLALKCYFGPHHPAQYRLNGPGACRERAKHSINNMYINFCHPMQTRQIESKKSTGYSSVFKLAIILGLCGAAVALSKVGIWEKFPRYNESVLR